MRELLFYPISQLPSSLPLELERIWQHTSSSLTPTESTTAQNWPPQVSFIVDPWFHHCRLVSLSLLVVLQGDQDDFIILSASLEHTRRHRLPL